ncbi:alpha/beta hydrolase [Streptomyces sp. V2]|uniref:alpha/beta hydrolase n=1 Tax=Streptomyces TaxID=1883 RepID=UPI0006EB5249|nr:MULTISPECIES: alpha/beta fold hydrolase [Streptomyces]PWG11805.1 alpha/beta hydrolase [Streptomyces sp. V2]
MPLPEPAPAARRITLDASGVALSALLCEPAGTPPRAVVVALHGGGMNAGYFTAPADPSLSLLTAARALGFGVLALDRPGYRASAALLPEGLGPRAQAPLVRAALADFAARHPTGAGLFLLGHSYGGKVALVTAAEQPPPGLLGVDVSGCGYAYALDPAEVARALERGRSSRSWGPLRLYPPGTFTAMRDLAEPMPRAERDELAHWPQLLRAAAPKVGVPVRFTFAEHEALWRHDPAALADLTALFAAGTPVTVDRQAHAGHNIGLGRSARAYHLRALAFLENCLIGLDAPRIRTAAPGGRP